MNIVTCGIDLAKSVFQVHGVDENEKVVVKKQLRRNQVLKFFAKLTPCLIGMEACGSAHYWSRELTKLGHTVKLMSPQHVKPYIKGNKNDANDAAGICEAVTRPSMKFVGAKSIEQQDILMLHRIRSQKVKHRTALINQIRGLLAEFGIVLTKRVDPFKRELLLVLSDSNCHKLSELGRRTLYQLYEDMLQLDTQLERVERELKEATRACDACQRLMSLPGVGWITASALVAHIGDVTQFKNGRELSAYFGLVPRQYSSGGKNNLLGISKRGDAYIRTLVIHGSRSVLRHAKKKTDKDSLWLKQVNERRGHNIAAVAQANKTLRRAWALLTRQTCYQVAA